MGYSDELLSEAVATMLRNDVRSLPIVERKDKQKLVGWLTRASVMKARLRKLEEEQVREPGWLLRSRRTRKRG